jgi:hypothetical protein
MKAPSLTAITQEQAETKFAKNSNFTNKFTQEKIPETISQ